MKRKKYHRTPLILQFVASTLLKPLFRFFLHLKVEGRENLKNIDTSNGVIFASNHISHFDPGLMPVCLPLFSPLRPMFYVSRPHKSYEFHEPGDIVLKSFLSESWGSFEYVPGKKDYAVSLQHHARILRDGGSVCIFPEGGVSDDGEMKEARGGVGYLAVEISPVVVPVKIEGVHNITMRDFFLRKRKAKIMYGMPFTIEKKVYTEEIEKYYKSRAEEICQTIKKM